MSVSTGPGANAFTRIPEGANSAAIERVNDVSAALPAAYIETAGANMNAPTDTMLTGTSWAQASAFKPGVSPSRLSSGVARRSEWPCLAVDVLRDDRQRCASAGDGEVGRGPGVSAHPGADTVSGVLAAHGVGGAALEPLHQRSPVWAGWCTSRCTWSVSPLNSTSSTSSSARTARTPGARAARTRCGGRGVCDTTVGDGG